MAFRTSRPARRRRSSAIGLAMVLIGFVVGCDTPPPGLPAFSARIDLIDGWVRGRMDGRSMHPGCPVGYDDLRYLTMSYVGFDGQAHVGEMVTHAVVAEDIVAVFRLLYNTAFPIRRMTLVDDFGGDDQASMAADNTSAFNCRLSTGSTTTWSQHAYGWAVDLNPLENPYVSGATVLPPGGAPYLNRSAGAPGMIVEGDFATFSFDAIGWKWGGRWSGVRDYQHFVK